MAIVYPLANGNWSTLANWYSGGIPYGQLPQPADDVYLDNKAIVLDVDATVLNLYMTARIGGTAGGTITSLTTRSFTCNTIYPYSTYTTIVHGGLAGTTLTITANLVGSIFNTGNTGGVILLGAGNIIFNGNITMTNGHPNAGAYINGTGLFTLNGNANGSNYYAVNILGTGRAVINGIINGGTAVLVSSTSTTALTLNGLCTSGASNALQNTSTGTITINGNQTAIGTAGVYAILNSSTGIITINGDCLGALSATPSNAYIVNNNSTGVLNINGNVTARSVGPSTTAGIVNNASTGTINVSTNVSGGTVANTIGISNASTGTINVTGNITGGSHATNTPAIYSTTAGTIDITGSCSADAYPALFSTSTTAVNRLRGNVLTKNGIVAYYSFKINISPTAAQQFTFQDTSNANRLIATSNISPGAPGIADVRFGTVYGSSSEYTGTLIVPSPSNVRKGVSTDATVGTADLTAADMWNALTSTMTTAGSIGERLKVASTVQSTGDQLASYIV